MDPKGRIVLPATFRASFDSKKGYFAPVELGGVALWSDAEFVRLAQKLRAQLQGDLEGELAARRMAAQAFPVTFDGTQGRLAIPETLRTAFGLEGTVVITGVFDHVEIWSPAKFYETLGLPSFNPRGG
jgi:MraZ protein